MIQKKRKYKVPTNCVFCKEKTDPSYKDVVALSKFMSDRGRIIGKDHSGVCAKHQRGLANAVKQARHLALLPFVTGL